MDAYNNLLLTISSGSQTLYHPNPMINFRISSGQGSAVWRYTVNVLNIIEKSELIALSGSRQQLCKKPVVALVEINTLGGSSTLRLQALHTLLPSSFRLFLFILLDTTF